MRLNYAVTLPTLLLTIGMLASDSKGCDFNLRDQVDLIRLSGLAPSAGGSQVIPLAGARVWCANAGNVSIVRPSQSAGSFFVLDTTRVFHRWDETGLDAGGDGLGGLRAALSAYEQSRDYRLWDFYGRTPLSDKEKLALRHIDVAKLSWGPIQLITEDRFRVALSESVPVELQGFFRARCHDQVQLYLAYNGYENAQLQDEQCGPVTQYTSEATVKVTVVQKGKVEQMVLELPVNLGTAPYVGHATLSTKH